MGQDLAGGRKQPNWQALQRVWDTMPHDQTLEVFCVRDGGNGGPGFQISVGGEHWAEAIGDAPELDAAVSQAVAALLGAPL